MPTALFSCQPAIAMDACLEPRQPINICLPVLFGKMTTINLVADWLSCYGKASSIGCLFNSPMTQYLLNLIGNTKPVQRTNRKMYNP